MTALKKKPTPIRAVERFPKAFSAWQVWSDAADPEKEYKTYNYGARESRFWAHTLEIGNPSEANFVTLVPDYVERRIEELEEKNKDLECKIFKLEQALTGNVIEIRAITNDSAMQEISAYFKKHDGEAIYPSDIAEELRLDYDQVKQAIAKLEKEGKIARHEN